ncbi:MAG: hypothetical protein J6Y43_07955, partial [Clostridia bacterium]|nr:hypothetical protein [Clostridia bacterium]
SNAHFVVNGVTVTLTDTSTGRNYIGVVEDDKLKLFTGTAGALVGGTYDVTTHISGLNFKLYTNATVSVSGGYTVAGESEIKFDIFSASWNTIKDRTESGQYNINLKEGTFDKRLATYENNDFHADMSFRTSALKETLPDEFYAVTFIKGDLTENTGGFRVGIRTAAASTDYTASLMQNPGGIPIVQETDSWYNWGAYDKTSLKNYGYWLVVHYDAVNHQKTTYLSDEDGNYLEKRATVTRETIYTSDLDAIGIKMWAANGNANYPAIPYTVNTTALRFGTSLTGAFNRSVSVDILNTANCSASVTDYSVFAGSPAGSDLYSIKPDRGYQVSAVEINDIALPCPYHDCYLIKDTVFTPVISTIAERIDLTDADITNSGAANSVTSYNSRIGVSEFTWQGFIGFPKDTSLDLSVSAKWNVCVMFYTDVKPNGAPQVQLLRWNNSVYIKAFRDSSNATALATTINDNPEIMETLIEDKGLNVRVVFYGNKISVYVLAGAGRTKWYQTHDRFEIATEGSFVNKISNYKDLSDISSID